MGYILSGVEDGYRASSLLYSLFTKFSSVGFVCRCGLLIAYIEIRCRYILFSFFGVGSLCCFLHFPRLCCESLFFDWMCVCSYRFGGLVCCCGLSLGFCGGCCSVLFFCKCFS